MKINSRFIACLHNAFQVSGMLEMASQREKCETFFLGGEGGHGSGPPYEIAPEERGRHLPSTPLVMKVTSIVYNPPFQKFLDPPMISTFIIIIIIM